MNEWQTISLKDAIKPGRGISYGIVQPGTHLSDGVPIIRVSDIRNGRLATDAPLRVLASIEQQYSRTRLAGGELLITIVGTVGETVIAPSAVAGWNVARAVAVLPIREDIGAYWVQLALKSPIVRALIDSRLNTTVQATLNLGDLAQLPILLPPEEHRRSIASILRALDDKIDLNRHINETLEAMSQAIFKDWFVEFGPTRAKMEGRPAYLAPEIWKLFPDRLDNEVKPEGWSYTTVERLMELVYGKALPANERKAGSIPVYGSGGIIGFHTDPLVNGPSVIVGRKGTVGSLYWEHRPLFPIDTVFYLRSSLPLVYCYHLLETLGLRGMNTDAAVPGLNRANVYRLIVPQVPDALIQIFGEHANLLRKKMVSNLEEINSLTATRDLLLPKLMSGEIRLKDAKKIAETA